MKKPQPKIPYVTWRNGRPRFEPSKTLRDRGYKGKDLRNEDDGYWMTAGQALDWSQEFAREIEAEQREQARAKARMPAEKPQRIAPVLPTYPLEQLWKDWLTPEKNPATADISPKSQYEYRRNGNVIATQMPDVWAAEAAALTKPICLGMYDRIRTNSGLAEAVNTMRRLGTALQWAMDRGKLPEMLVNPAHKLRMKTPPSRIRAGTPAEIEQMVKVADAIGLPEIADMIVLGVWTGQRQNDRRQFTFLGRERGRVNFRQMKTKAIVSIPEAPELTNRIKAMQERRKRAEVVSPHVVLDERDWSQFDTYSYYKRYTLVKAAATSGLPAQGHRKAIKPMPSCSTLRDQDLRDTAVTWLARAGCTIPEICAITGHTFNSANEILKHYLAMHPELADNAMRKMVTWHEAGGAETYE